MSIPTLSRALKQRQYRLGGNYSIVDVGDTVQTNPAGQIFANHVCIWNFRPVYVSVGCRPILSWNKTEE